MAVTGTRRSWNLSGISVVRISWSFSVRWPRASSDGSNTWGEWRIYGVYFRAQIFRCGTLHRQFFIIIIFFWRRTVPWRKILEPFFPTAATTESSHPTQVGTITLFRFIWLQNSVWCQINRKSVITIQIWFELTRFRKVLSVCNGKFLSAGRLYK